MRNNRTARPLILVGTLLTGVALVLSAASLDAQASLLEKERISAPHLPARQEMYPEIYDGKGCLKQLSRDGGGSICPPNKDPHPTPVPKNPSKMLRGYRGKYYAEEVDSHQVVVMQESLSFPADSNWISLGLVRNETTVEVDELSVTATIYNGSGDQIGRLNAEVLVPLLRPGEPAPFIVRSDIPRDSVSRVEWAVSSKPSSTIVHRDFEIKKTREMQFGAPSFKGHPRVDSPYPYVLSVSTRNLGPTTKNPRLVVAWLDEKGRVIWLEQTGLHENANSEIETNGVAQFRDIRISDDKIGPNLTNTEQVMWVVGE